MSKQNFGWPQEPFDSPGRRIILGEHVKKSRGLHAMCLLMFLCSATILIGSLTLGGTLLEARLRRDVSNTPCRAPTGLCVPTIPHPSRTR